MNQAYETYYQSIQTHISELMIASLGIGSGYIAVTQSTAATVVGWIGTAISSVFPPAAIATSLIEAGVNYLDASYRERFLAKVKVFGTTVTDAEILGEQIARLLVRAYFHENRPITQDQADIDTKALIIEIVTAEPPIKRDEDCAERLLTLIWGEHYCIDPLPEFSTITQKIEPIATSKMVLGIPDTGVPTQEKSVAAAQYQGPSLEEHNALNQKFKTLEARFVQLTQGGLEVSAGNAGLAKGMTNPHVSREAKTHAQEIQHIQIQTAYTESHVAVLTAAHEQLHEEHERTKARLEEVTRFLISAKLLPKHNIYAEQTTVQHQSAESNNAMISAEKATTHQSKNPGSLH